MIVRPLSMTLLRLLPTLALVISLSAACKPSVPMPATPPPQPVPAPGTPEGAAAAPRGQGVTPTTAAPLPQGTDGMPWWNDTVFYEVFVRSFADSTSGPLANDGIGDLQGLIERLDYLNDGNPSTTTDLGITGIWLMPIAQSPSYHGYDVVDYYTVEKDYGTNEDFRRLMAEAHRRGIRVIVDLVLNHTSREHPWFTDAAQPGSAHRDWYIWATEDPGYRGPWGQQVWHRLGSQWYYGIFWEGMPDLNYRTPAVTEEMLKVTRYWLTEMGADGFRLDAVRHLVEKGRDQENTEETYQWLRNFHQVVKAANPAAFTVGEIWQNTQIAASYVPDAVDTAFNFDLAQDILDSVNNRLRGPVIVSMENTLSSFPPGQYGTFLTNHDQNRAMTVLANKVDRAKVAATILLTLPGVPFLYYGEEIGMTGMKPDEKLRTPMQWTAGPNAGFSTHAPWQEVNRDYEQVNVQAQAADGGSLLAHYRTLIALRNTHPALRVGDMALIESGSRQVLAYLRQSAAETLLVVINLDERPVSNYGLAATSSRLAGRLQATELLAGAAVVPPSLDAQGGFADYKPMPELAARTGYVIRLAP